MRYALVFSICVACLTTGAVVTFDRISILSTVATPADSSALPFADTLPTADIVTPAVPTDLDYARFAEADLAWREVHAHQYSIAELRGRGDGRRTARDSVEDRVYRFMQSGQRRLAIAELERWVRTHPTDRELLLSLARLLTEDGRNDDAIARYRQILALRAPGE